MLLSGVNEYAVLSWILMLVGTVINNGIPVYRYGKPIPISMDAETALVYAGRSRHRPILMTTLTTVLSLIPMGLGIGEGSGYAGNGSCNHRRFDSFHHSDASPAADLLSAVPRTARIRNHKRGGHQERKCPSRLFPRKN